MNFQKIDERPRSFSTFEDTMQAIREREGCTKLEATEKAAHRHPELVERYNKDSELVAKSIAKAAAPLPVAQAATDFNKRVD